MTMAQNNFGRTIRQQRWALPSLCGWVTKYAGGEFRCKRYSLWGSPLGVTRLLRFFRNSENNGVTEILERRR